MQIQNSTWHRELFLVLQIIQGFCEIDVISECALDFSRHCSALKLEKSAISKVQKHIIRIFKNGKNSIFAPEKSPKIAFLIVLNFFLVQKLIFLPFLKLLKMCFYTFEIALFFQF